MVFAFAHDVCCFGLLVLAEVLFLLIFKCDRVLISMFAPVVQEALRSWYQSFKIVGEQKVNVVVS